MGPGAVAVEEEDGVAGVEAEDGPCVVGLVGGKGDGHGGGLGKKVRNVKAIEVHRRDYEKQFSI